MQQDDAPEGFGPGRCHQCGGVAVAKFETCALHAPTGVAYENAGFIDPAREDAKTEAQKHIDKCFQQVLSRKPRAVLAFCFDEGGNFISTAAGSALDLTVLYAIGGEATSRFLNDAQQNVKQGLNG